MFLKWCLPSNTFVITGEAYCKALFISLVKLQKPSTDKVLASSYSDIRWLVLPLKSYLPRHAFLFNSEVYFKTFSLSLVFASWLFHTVRCTVSLLRKKLEIYCRWHVDTRWRPKSVPTRWSLSANGNWRCISWVRECGQAPSAPMCRRRRVQGRVRQVLKTLCRSSFRLELQRVRQTIVR